MTAISRWPQFTIETQGKGQIVIILYKAYLLGFLLDFLKSLYGNYTTLQAQSDGRICVSVLKTVLKWQLFKDGHDSP